MVEMLSPMFQRDKRLVGWDLTARVARLPHAAAESEAILAQRRGGAEKETIEF